MPSLLGSIMRVGWWAWLPSIYIADLAALAGGHRNELGNQVSSLPWGVAGFIIAFTVFVGLGHWRRARRSVSASSASPSSKPPLARPVPPPPVGLIELDYPAVLSHLQALIGCRVRVGFAHWPNGDPMLGYITGYLRLATPGWTLNPANPDEALGFTLTHAPDGADTIGGFVISADHLHDAHTTPTGQLGLHIDDLIIAIAPDRGMV